MSISASVLHVRDSVWHRFWHAPVRAERLALTRVLLATSLLADELVQYWPNLADFFGPNGLAPAGVNDAFQLENWQWSYLFFGTDNLVFITVAFWLWVAVTVAFLIGWQTRCMNVMVWFMTRCFVERNPFILYGADDVMKVGLLLLILAPSGDALSVDAWQRRRAGLLRGSAWVKPWSLRILQIQLCLIYGTSGLAKLKGTSWGEGPITEWFHGPWWNGTAIHYFLNDMTIWRRSYAEYPIPLWITMPMTYISVWWETLFPVFLLNRRTRPLSLVFGVLFHLGIFFTVDIAWFAFYTLSLYPLWIPDSFWQWLDQKGGILSFRWARSASSLCLVS